MRTSLIISLVLLMLTIGGGMLEESKTLVLSQRYQSAAKELHILTEKEEWARAGETIAAYIDAWEETVPWLQILINHEDIDDVTLALVRLQAAVEAREQSACFEACAELEENARHIHHRDAFTLGNVL